MNLMQILQREKIKTLRNQRRMTQTALAGDQITRNMLSLIENGSALPSLSTILYLAERLDIPAGLLLARDQEELMYRKSEELIIFISGIGAKRLRQPRHIAKIYGRHGRNGFIPIEILLFSFAGLIQFRTGFMEPSHVEGLSPQEQMAFRRNHPDFIIRPDGKKLLTPRQTQFVFTRRIRLFDPRHFFAFAIHQAI